MRRRRLLQLGLAAVPFAAAIAWALLALDDMTAVERLRLVVDGVRVLEACHVVALFLGTLGLVAFAVALIHARRRGQACPRIARGVLLCASVTFALMLCEAGSAVLLLGRDRATQLPAQGPPPSLLGAAGTLIAGRHEAVFPTTFAETRPDELNVLILGESSAAGVPYDLFRLSPGALLRWKLAEALPGRSIVVDVKAFSGMTLDAEVRTLEKLSRRPDLVMVYCGHNEFSARAGADFEPAYYADPDPPGAWEAFVAGVERTSSVCALARDRVERLSVGLPPRKVNRRRLVDVPVFTRGDFDALLDDFERQLDAAAGFAEQVGAVAVLVVPPANDAGFEPNRSYLPADVPAAERRAFGREVEAARALESVDPPAAIRAYEALVARRPGFAEAHYRLGRLYQAAGAGDEAYRQFVAARDADGFPMRCPSAFQDAYRRVAARRGCLLVDGQAVLRAASPTGQLDDALFLDAMHPGPRGHAVLAEAVLRALHARRAFGWPADPAPRIDPTELPARFPIDPPGWEKLAGWGAMVWERMSYARFDPSERLARRGRFIRAAQSIAAGTPPDRVGIPSIGFSARDGGPPR